MHVSFLAGLTRVADLEPRATTWGSPIEFPAMAAYTIDNGITHVVLHNPHHLDKSRRCGNSARSVRLGEGAVSRSADRSRAPARLPA